MAWRSQVAGRVPAQRSKIAVRTERKALWKSHWIVRVGGVMSTSPETIRAEITRTAGTIDVEATLDTARAQLQAMAEKEAALASETAPLIHAVFNQFGNGPLGMDRVVGVAAANADPSLVEDWGSFRKACESVLHGDGFTVTRGRNGGVSRD